MCLGLAGCPIVTVTKADALPVFGADVNPPRRGARQHLAVPGLRLPAEGWRSRYGTKAR